MMNRVLFIGLILSLTSCFDVIDEVNLKDDGSGDFTLTVNMSKSKTKLASIMLLDSVRGVKVPDEPQVIAFIDDLKSYLEGSEGISQVKRTYDFSEFIFTLSFHFESVENINSAITHLQFKNGKKPESFNLRYSYNKSTKKFSRYYETNEVDQRNFNKLPMEDQNMVAEAIYISICRFSSEVASVTNKKAKVSPNGKAVMLRTNAADLIKGNTKLTTTVQLK